MEPESTKTCQSCGEQVLSVAIMCKHCGERLDHTAPKQRSRAVRTFVGVLAVAVVAAPALVLGWHAVEKTRQRRQVLAMLDTEREVCVQAGRIVMPDGRADEVCDHSYAGYRRVIDDALSGKRDDNTTYSVAVAIREHSRTEITRELEKSICGDVRAWAATLAKSNRSIFTEQQLRDQGWACHSITRELGKAHLTPADGRSPEWIRDLIRTAPPRDEALKSKVREEYVKGKALCVEAVRRGAPSTVAPTATCDAAFVLAKTDIEAIMAFDKPKYAINSEVGYSYRAGAGIKRILWSSRRLVTQMVSDEVQQRAGARRMGETYEPAPIPGLEKVSVDEAVAMMSTLGSMPEVGPEPSFFE